MGEFTSAGGDPATRKLAQDDGEDKLAQDDGSDGLAQDDGEVRHARIVGLGD
jgi:hypothetical protein